MFADARARRIAALRAAIGGRPRLAALALYLGLSAALFARAAAPHFASVYLGKGIDPTFFIWCLVWWPYAIAHHLNPFVCSLIYVPDGFNLTWATSIPLLSLLAFPLTATAGPIAAFNLLCVLLPALDAWSAFLLCHRLTRRFWPSMMGGYVFGFSSYLLAHLLGGHLSLCAVFLLPLATYLVLMRLAQKISARGFALVLLALLTAQFLISTEVLATMTLFGAIALAAAWLMGTSELRKRIAALAAPLAAAYAGTALLMSPYLYYVFADFRRVSIYSPSWHSVDLLNFVVPTATMELGDIVGMFGRLCASFTSGIAEQGAYIGLPLLGIAGWVVLARRGEVGARLLALMLVVTLLAALGPRLHVAGRASFKLPWSLFHRTPLLDQALPARLTLYSFLVLAVTAAMWLSMERVAPWLRVGGAILMLASLLPNPSTRLWVDPARRPPPAFFTQAMYRRYLASGETVAVLPYALGESENCMLWQALSGMYFRLAGGYFPLTPLGYRLWPAVRSSIENVALSDPADQWKAFAASHGVTAAIFAGASPETNTRQLEPILRALGTPAAEAGNVELFRLPPQVMAQYGGLGWPEMEALEDEQRFAALLIAARNYLAAGSDPSGLSARRAAAMGLLPARLVAIAARNLDYRVELGGSRDGRVRVGLSGSAPAIHALIERYGADALEIYYPYPPKQRAERQSGRRAAVTSAADPALYQPMVMIFDRAGLERAAVSASHPAHRARGKDGGPTG